jgi:hypothetical protein
MTGGAVTAVERPAAPEIGSAAPHPACGSPGPDGRSRAPRTPSAASRHPGSCSPHAPVTPLRAPPVPGPGRARRDTPRGSGPPDAADRERRRRAPDSRASPTRPPSRGAYRWARQSRLRVPPTRLRSDRAVRSQRCGVSRRVPSRVAR